eukprot:15451858-Alexandrium_andersonii.AAC.1
MPPLRARVEGGLEDPVAEGRGRGRDQPAELEVSAPGIFTLPLLPADDKAVVDRQVVEVVGRRGGRAAGVQSA